MSTSTRPAWSDDCFKPAPERHYKGKRPSRRLVAGNSARTTSVASIVTQEGVHADEAADWLGLGARRRGPESVPPPPSGTRSLREALEARATQHAAGQTTARKSMREPAERYQRELPPPPPVAPSSEPEAPTPPPPPPPVATQTDSRRLGRRHFGGDVHARTRPEGLLAWDESAHEAAVRARAPTATRISVRARQGAPAPTPPPDTSLGRVIGWGDAL
jgi:hypothetical protein